MTHACANGSGGRRNESEEKPKKEPEQLYSEEKYQQLLQFIINSGILEELNYDPVKVKAFCDRLTADLVKMCEEQRAKLYKR